MSNTRWGCPWHGLIRDGKIHTHTGRTVAYPQPATGNTHLIDFGMPEIDTPQSDSLAGMEWRNKAIMQGRFLCGALLPVGGWIYRDPAGKNWLVETVGFGGGGGWGPFVDGQAFELKLSRFGVIGGASESYSVTLVTPPINQDAADAGLSLGGISAGYDLECVTPEGGRATYRLFRSAGIVSFIEFTLSGPGESCLASVKIARTAIQTNPARVVTGDKFGTLGTVFYRSRAILADPQEEWGPTVDGCPAYLTRVYDISLKSTVADLIPLGPVHPVESGEIFEWSTEYSEVVPSRILALFYEFGVLKEITETREHRHSSASGDITYSFTVFPTHHQEYRAHHAWPSTICEAVNAAWLEKASLYTHRETVSEESVSVSISVAGVEVMRESAFRNVRVIAEHWVDDLYPSPVPGYPQSWNCASQRSRVETVITTNDGETRDIHEPALSDIGDALPGVPFPREAHRVMGSVGQYDVRINPYPFAAEGPPGEYKIQAARNSNSVCSLYVMAPRFKATSLAATPRGAVQVPEITHDTLSAPAVVGSFNPVTGEVARRRGESVSWI